MWLSPINRSCGVKINKIHLRIMTNCIQGSFWGPGFSFYNMKLPLNIDCQQKPQILGPGAAGMIVVHRFDRMHSTRERSLLYKSKGKDHVPSTSQKPGLTRLYKKFLFMSTTAISKLVFQEVDGTVILPLTW